MDKTGKQQTEKTPKPYVNTADVPVTEEPRKPILVSEIMKGIL
jgi:hypothetical protein